MSANARQSRASSRSRSPHRPDRHVSAGSARSIRTAALPSEYCSPDAPTSSQGEHRVHFTEREIESRREQFASSRSIVDRQKFEAEFNVGQLQLRPEFADIYTNNPHLREVFANRQPFLTEPLLSASQRILPADLRDAQRRAYERRTAQAKTTEHWGQRFSSVAFVS